MTRRIHSFVWGGLAGAFGIGFGIYSFIGNDSILGVISLVAGILAFTFVSCLILDNNFIGDLVGEIFSWGFVSLPGLIFELSLDGIIWLITVKLLFWILGLILACITGILAVVCGAILSVFVYPFALVKNIRGVE